MLRRVSVFFVLLICISGHAQVRAELQIWVNGNHSVRITIPAPVSLSLVLDRFCRETGRTCSGTEVASRRTLPAYQITGNEHEVLRELFDGTGLNYVATEQSVDAPGVLIISEASAPELRAPAAPELPAITDNLHSSGNNSETGSDDASSADLQESMINSETAATLGTGVTGGFLPFPDAHGRPVPIDSGTPSGSPFPLGRHDSTDQSSSGNFLPLPDDSGKPVPIQAGTGGSPFGPTSAGRH